MTVRASGGGSKKLNNMHVYNIDQQLKQRIDIYKPERTKTNT